MTLETDLERMIDEAFFANPLGQRPAETDSGLTDAVISRVLGFSPEEEAYATDQPLNAILQDRHWLTRMDPEHAWECLADRYMELHYVSLERAAATMNLSPLELNRLIERDGIMERKYHRGRCYLRRDQFLAGTFALPRKALEGN